MNNNKVGWWVQLNFGNNLGKNNEDGNFQSGLGGMMITEKPKFLYVATNGLMLFS